MSRACRSWGVGAALAAALSLSAAARGAAQGPALPPLPDSTGWGVHVLTLGRGPDAS